MSDQIRSALSPKFGDEFDRIFGVPSEFQQRKADALLQLEVLPKYFAQGKLVKCETCYEEEPGCVHTSEHYEHGGPCERHGCQPPLDNSPGKV